MKAESKTVKSPVVAGFMAVAMVFNSPAGHDALYEGMVRVAFAKTWLQYSNNHEVDLTGMGVPIRFNIRLPISFQEFRDNAELYAYDPDPNVHINNIKLLNGRVSLCLTDLNPNDDENPDAPYPTNFACHAATSCHRHKGGNAAKQYNISLVI